MIENNNSKPVKSPGKITYCRLVVDGHVVPLLDGYSLEFVSEDGQPTLKWRGERIDRPWAVAVFAGRNLRSKGV